MKICEDCIKQDVCKFTEKVSKLKLKDNKLPDPLIPELKCPNMRTEPSNCHYTTGTDLTWTATTAPCTTTSTVTYPLWDVGDSPLPAEVTWC